MLSYNNPEYELKASCYDEEAVNTPRDGEISLFRMASSPWCIPDVSMVSGKTHPEPPLSTKK
jgi:hypothetical protein